MTFDSLSSLVSRICFTAGFLFLALAVVEELARWFGGSVLGLAYEPKTLLGIAAVLFVVVIALLLRQIREKLKIGAV